ncbi:MAG: caspase family protein [Nostoc sp.]|uniref:caspase family protein n=1 Tax=Nostoc sp. TaxID=1180 RepID=UPI002FF9FCB0
MVKVALLIGVSEYGNGLSSLPAAPKDVDAMREVLENIEIGGFDQVTPLINPERQAMEEAIYTLFANRKKDDLLLLFFSGHGVKDDSGNLYLAAHNTRKEQEALVQPTAVAASYVQNTMSNSRSKRQVVILDCCFSGAFAEGMKAKDDGSVPVQQQLGGEGRAVLTSSTSTQYSFEHQGFDLSVYTHFLVEGLKTGIADRDKDGGVSIDELHEYASEKVQETAPGKMKPKIYVVEEGFKILLAKVQTEDPKLKYRQEVERRLKDGKIPSITRNLLDLKQGSLGILPEQAAAIEAEVLKPYREYEAKLQQYEQVLSEAIEAENPLTEYTRNQLKDYQEFWGLRDKDVELIENRIIPRLQEQRLQPANPPQPSNLSPKNLDTQIKTSIESEQLFEALIRPKRNLSIFALPVFAKYLAGITTILVILIAVYFQQYLIPNSKPTQKAQPSNAGSEIIKPKINNTELAIINKYEIMIYFYKNRQDLFKAKNDIQTQLKKSGFKGKIVSEEIDKSFFEKRNFTRPLAYEIRYSSDEEKAAAIFEKILQEIYPADKLFKKAIGSNTPDSISIFLGP